MATWDCFRLPPGAPGHLSLARVVALAEAAGGAEHGFRCDRACWGRGWHERTARAYGSTCAEQQEDMPCLRLSPGP